MKLLVQSAMIFFGTLMTAGVVALGEPGRSGAPQHDASSARALQRLLQAAQPWTRPSADGYNDSGR